MLHDIGRGIHQDGRHITDGYELLVDLGWEEEAVACLTHSYFNGGRYAFDDVACNGFYLDENGNPHIPEEEKDDLTEFLENYEYTAYDTILNVADLMATSSAIVSPKDRIADIDSRRKSDERNRGYFIAEVTNALVSMLKRMSESEKIKAYIPSEEIKHSKGVSISEIEERFALVSAMFFTCYETIFREDNKPKDMNPEYYGLRKYVERIDIEPEF